VIPYKRLTCDQASHREGAAATCVQALGCGQCCEAGMPSAARYTEASALVTHKDLCLQGPCCQGQASPCTPHQADLHHQSGTLSDPQRTPQSTTTQHCR
jgi:hypothetical protein